MPHALVVDDNPMILMAAMEILEEAGFGVFCASNGHLARETLLDRGNDISLLFTDVEMPGSIDGFFLARLAAERWGHIRILVASGQVKPQPGDLPEGALFIPKPFSAEVVYARLHEILDEDQKPEPLLNINRKQ